MLGTRAKAQRKRTHKKREIGRRVSWINKLRSPEVSAERKVDLMIKIPKIKDKKTRSNFRRVLVDLVKVNKKGKDKVTVTAFGVLLKMRVPERTFKILTELAFNNKYLLGVLAGDAVTKKNISLVVRIGLSNEDVVRAITYSFMCKQFTTPQLKHAQALVKKRFPKSFVAEGNEVSIANDFLNVLSNEINRRAEKKH